MRRIHYFNPTQFSNLGDAIAPLLMKKLSGEDCEWVPANAQDSAWMLVGSIFHEGIDNNFSVWGAGCISQRPRFESRANIYSLRGPLTRSLTRLDKTSPVPIGDPGLIAPLLLDSPPKKEKRATNLLLALTEMLFPTCLGAVCPVIRLPF